jgi:integrase
MTRQLNRLSQLQVKNAGEKGSLHDGGGLYLQVSKTGTKSWLFCYRLNGREREMGLGAYPIVSLAEARGKRDEYRKLLAQKIDPLEARKEEEARSRFAAAHAKTFQQCAEAFIEAQQDGWKNKKHIQQWTNTLKTYVYPVIGKFSVQDIDVDAVMKVLEPIWKTKTETANRTRGRIEKVLDWAAARGLRKGENPALWRGKLGHLLAHRSKIQKVKHHPALPYQEIGEFMAILKEQPSLDARALEFTIFTVARTNEVIKARWEEMDLDNKVWTIPAARMKAGREHRIPLTQEAIDVLRQALELTGQNNKKGTFPKNGWVFPGRIKDKSLSGMAMLMLLRRMERKDITVHGFRSTFRDWAAEQTAFPREVAEAALAHATGDKVEAAYFRSDLFDKRRRMMEAWERYCVTMPLAKKDNVTTFTKKGSF